MIPAVCPHILGLTVRVQTASSTPRLHTREHRVLCFLPALSFPLAVNLCSRTISSKRAVLTFEPVCLSHRWSRCCLWPVPCPLPASGFNCSGGRSFWKVDIFPSQAHALPCLRPTENRWQRMVPLPSNPQLMVGRGDAHLPTLHLSFLGFLTVSPAALNPSCLFIGFLCPLSHSSFYATCASCHHVLNRLPTTTSFPQDLLWGESKHANH